MPLIVSAVESEKTEEIVRSNCYSTPQKRRLRSSAAEAESPMTWKLPRQCSYSSPNTPSNKIEKESGEKANKRSKSAVKKLVDNFTENPNWNPRDMEQVSAVKEVLHVSTAPSSVVCCEDEQKRIFDFCKAYIEQEKAGSLYVCGCPGTGKSLSMEKVKHHLIDWANEAAFHPPDVLAMNCSSLTKTSEIFTKIICQNQPRKINGSISPLQHLQSLYSQQHVWMHPLALPCLLL